MDGRTKQNLIDAGCSEAFIERFAATPTSRERLRQLQGHRKGLLGSIHSEQRKLDCLDYLIYQMGQTGNQR